MNEMLSTFKALSDKTRLRITSVLIQSATPLCICEIMDSLEIPQYTVSKHVKELKTAGIVAEERVGKFVFYAIKKPADVFHQRLIENLKASLSGMFPRDNARLGKRLDLRSNGQCVVGKKKHPAKGKIS